MKILIAQSRYHLIQIVLLLIFVYPTSAAEGTPDYQSIANKSSQHSEHDKPEHQDSDDYGQAGLHLSTDEQQEFFVKLAQAQAGVINQVLDLTGEVIVEPEHLYHVVPRVAGIVRKVYKHLGESVLAGALLATLSSQDLADAKAQFIATNSLLKLANTNLQRERQLYKAKITAKSEYLQVQQVQIETAIKHKAAGQKLQVLGLSEKSVRAILNNAEKDLTLFELRAPAAGIIINKHATLGELLATHTRSFTIADLSSVWVNLTVYQKDLWLLHQGQKVLISNQSGGAQQVAPVASIISWLSPTLAAKTRSATARVVLDNADGRWRPGLFVNAKVAISQSSAAIVIPQTALQTVNGKTVVFIQHQDGDFAAQPITIGRSDGQHVEIINGLQPGQTFVSNNAFILKAQMQKGEFSDGHNH